MKVNQTVIQLGRHTLIYGDATKKEAYQHIREPVDLLLTDPPYNVNYKGGSKLKRRPLLNDRLGKRYATFVASFLTQAKTRLKKGGVYYIFCASSEIHTYQQALETLDFYQSHQLIWAKNHFNLSFADYKVKHEHILYGWRKGATHRFYGVKNSNTLLTYPKPTKSKAHPTMKPQPLLATLIKNSTKEDDVVLDVFGGRFSPAQLESMPTNVFGLVTEVSDRGVWQKANTMLVSRPPFIYRKDGVVANYANEDETRRARQDAFAAIVPLMERDFEAIEVIDEQIKASFGMINLDKIDATSISMLQEEQRINDAAHVYNFEMKQVSAQENLPIIPEYA